MVLFLPMHLALSCFITNIVYVSVACEAEVNFNTQKLCRNKLFAIYTILTIRLAFWQSYIQNDKTTEKDLLI